MKKILVCTADLLFRHLKMNMLIILQIAVTLFIFTGFIGQIQYLYKVSGITKTFSDCEAYYYFPYFNYDPDFVLQDFLENKGFSKVRLGDIKIFDVNINGENETVTAYDSVILDYVNITPESGKWITEFKNTDAIPVISSVPEYQTGDELKITDAYGIEHDAFICGSISEEDYVLSFRDGGSPEISDISFFVSNPYTDIIVPFNCTDICSITEDFLMINDSIFSVGKILIPDENIDKKELESTVSRYGIITDVRAMTQNYEKYNRSNLIISGIILIVFSVLTITGIGGINGLQNRTNKRYYVIWYMTGLKTGECAVVELCRIAIIAIISLLFYITIYYCTSLKDIMDNGEIIIDIFTFTLSFAFVFLLFSITSLGYVIKLGKSNIMINYKNKD